MARAYFRLFYDQYIFLTSRLSNEEAGRLLLGMLRYLKEDVEPDLTLSTLEAERRIFSLDLLLGEDELFKNWLPLPFCMSSVDGF